MIASADIFITIITIIIIIIIIICKARGVYGPKRNKFGGCLFYLAF